MVESPREEVSSCMMAELLGKILDLLKREERALVEGSFQDLVSCLEELEEIMGEARGLLDRPAYGRPEGVPELLREMRDQNLRNSVLIRNSLDYIALAQNLFFQHDTYTKEGGRTCVRHF